MIATSAFTAHCDIMNNNSVVIQIKYLTAPTDSFWKYFDSLKRSGSQDSFILVSNYTGPIVCFWFLWAISF